MKPHQLIPYGCNCTTRDQASGPKSTTISTNCEITEPSKGPFSYVCLDEERKKNKKRN